MKKFYLFLDFDGVLHGEGISSKGLFEHISLFCRSLAPYKNQVEIIISSSWRKTHELTHLRSFFDSTIRDMITGITPILNDQDSYAKGGRQREIEQYCLINKINQEQWLAIDDQERFFDNDCSNVFFTESQIGLTEENLSEIISIIDNQKKLKPIF